MAQHEDSEAGPLSSRIHQLQESIWVDLTGTQRQQCITELDLAWAGRGWLPPWPEVQDTPNSIPTIESLASGDILNLATITRLCARHHVDLLSLWQPCGMIHQVATKGSSRPPLWSPEVCAQAVTECYRRYSPDKRRVQFDSVQPVSKPRTDSLSHEDARKRQRISVEELSAPSSSVINKQSDTVVVHTPHVVEALEKARNLQNKLLLFQLSLREHLEFVPREHQLTLESKIESAEQLLHQRRVEHVQATSDVKTTEEALKSMQEHTRASEDGYNLLKEWLEPVLLRNQTSRPTDQESGTQPDAELQNVMDTVSRVARQALTDYGGAVSGPESTNSRSQALDRACAAKERQDVTQRRVAESEDIIAQLKLTLALEEQRMGLEKMLRGVSSMLDSTWG